MEIPRPVAGQVIRYGYVWHRESKRGAETASKDRPCAVLLTVQDRTGRPFVTVLPVTHSPPDDPLTAVEIPARVKRNLGLDGERSWIILSEINQFRWPAPDYGPIRGTDPETSLYGELPGDLYRVVRDRWLELVAANSVHVVRRTE